MHGVVDEKTDVFAFGVFMLEVISGRKPVDGSHQSLHSWVSSPPFCLVNLACFIENAFWFLLDFAYSNGGM